MNKLIETLNVWFGEKAPALPIAAKEWLVKAAPYLVIIGIFVGASTALAIFGLGFGSISALIRISGVSLTGTFALHAALLILALVLQIASLPGLFKRTASGWNLTFYGAVVSLISGLLSGSLWGAVISGLISFYLIFQVRSYYFGMVVTNQPSQPVNQQSNPQ